MAVVHRQLKTSLKCVLLHNGYKLACIPNGQSVETALIICKDGSVQAVVQQKQMGDMC